MSVDYRQNAVSKAVWPWAEPPESTAPKRQSNGPRATVHAAIGYMIAALLYFYANKASMACVVCTISTIVLVSGWLIPPLFAAIERFGKWLGHALGTAVTWLLLVPFFYIFFTIGRLGLLLQGKDPLHRKFPTGDSTYWLKHPTPRPVESYRKQH